MTKIYQIMNDQDQPVITFRDADDAKALDKAEAYVVKELRELFPDQGFYVLELPVVYSNFPDTALLSTHREAS